MSSIERVRKEIAACRRAGREGRYRDALRAADAALAVASAPRDNDNRISGLHAAALGYRGMALLQLREREAAVLALEESYRLFNDWPTPPTSHCDTDASPPRPLLAKVAACLVHACRTLGREPPLPPLVKFPRTPHLFRPTNSQAVTDDDLVLAGDDALFALLAAAEPPLHVVSCEEKVDGANLGISLGLDGRTILFQNRSHYLSTVEHAQFSQVTAWAAVHGEELRRILAPSATNGGRRRILYGEWVVARHSIRYDRLPGYFVAFDLSDGDRFLSRRRFHEAMRGSGIPVAPALEGAPDLAGLNPSETKARLLDLLRTPSRFRSDGGPVEGIVIRVDRGEWMHRRCKLVDPAFTAGIAGHWAKRKIEKQRIDADFAAEYLEGCYCRASPESHRLSTEVANPRQRAAVSYGEADGRMQATCAILPKEPSSPCAGMVVLPRNLCWLWSNKEVLVASTPKSREQIRAMHDALNVGLVITLTKESPLPGEWFAEGDCANFLCPVVDGMPPTLKQMDDIGDAVVRTVCGGGTVVEHCGGGKGRAGTVAACLLLRFGMDGVCARIDAENGTEGDDVRFGRSLRPRAPFMSSEEAIAEVRRRRPGSIETVMQEGFVREYAQHLWRKASVRADDSSLDDWSQNAEAKSPGERDGPTKRRLPKYIVLAGLPGSGKSSLARRLSSTDGNNINNELVHASTDEMGKRGCCNVVGRAAAKVGQGRAGYVIVDACNLSPAKRREWIDVMHRPGRDSTALVFFDMPTEVCIERVRHRVDHPTIPFGRGATIVESYAKMLELPTEKESKLFGEIAVIRSEEDLAALLSGWGVSA